MLRIQLRKTQRSAPLSNVVFESCTGHFLEGDTVAIVTADDGRIYRFGAQALELPSGVRVSYEAISDYHWIAKTKDAMVKAAMKRSHYGTLILETSDGTSCEMTGLNQAVFPIMSFLRWFLKK